MDQPVHDATSWLDSTGHHDWLARHRESLLDFFQPEVVLPGAGYAYLDSRGHALPELGSQLWLGARMLHCFSIAAMLGRPGAEEVARHGIGFYLNGPGRDAEYGGWFPIVGGENPSSRKELYGQAHVLLGASSATAAGIPGGTDLLAAALETIEKFWVAADGAGIEAFDREFREAEPYRGQNANMHLTEAYLAAYEMIGEDWMLDRALGIARRIAGRAADAAEGAWRLPEHFDATWRELPDHNRDEPRHPFRPYGSQPGHWLEWSKLLLQIRSLGVREDWLLTAARNLFDGAFRDAWADNGGFCYTVDWDGSPVVPERFFWEIAEGIGAAAGLFRATGERRYEDAYRSLWSYADEHVIDHVNGSWWHELNSTNHPVTRTWVGKPDLYHAYQATCYALLPEDRGIAAWARDQHRGDIKAG
jgi:hypothetical protein